MTDNRRTSRNIIANIANFAVNIAFGIIFTRYLIGTLGIAAYGMVPLVINMTAVLSIFTLSINSSVGRFITVSLERHRKEEALSFFNTSLMACLGAVLLLTIPALAMINYSEHLMKMPAGMEQDSKLLLFFMTATFFLTVMGSSFEVSSFCTNRFDVRNTITIFTTSAKLGLIFLFFRENGPALGNVGAAIFLATAMGFCLCLVAWKKLTPQLRLRPSSFSPARLKTLLQSGGWISLNQVGTLLLLSIDVIIINRLYGPEKCGIYGSILQWAVMLRSLALTISAVLGPTIIKYYALGDLESLYTYSIRAVRLLGMFMALAVGLVSGFAEPVLTIWLGQPFGNYADLLILLVLPSCLNLSFSPLTNLFLATNKVMVPGIVQVVCGLANAILALFLAVVCDWGLYGIAAANIIVLTMKSNVFTPIYCARLLGRGTRDMLRNSAGIASATLCIFIVSHILAGLTSPTSLPVLIGTSALISISYLTLYYAPFCLDLKIGRKMSDGIAALKASLW